jgi:hypothetical protein
MQLDEAQARTTLTAGRDGRILLSTDAAVSALPAAAGPGASALFSADAVRVGDGETLVVQAPNGRPVRLETRLLEVGARGRVVLEAGAELRAGRGSFGTGSTVELVGADGAPGEGGPGGLQGTREQREAAQNAGPGTRGGAGKPGGGSLWFDQLSGTLTVVAGGGSGGGGGPGGAGG